MIPITIREPGDLEDHWEYPCLTEQGLVALEPGEAVVGTLSARSLYVTILDQDNQRTSQALKLEDSVIEVSVTDQRVVYLCRKYDKGGGWAGFGVGAAVAAVANGVSRHRAAARSRGTALAGQMRFPWIGAVGGSAKQGWLDSDSILLAGKRPDEEGRNILQVRLDLQPGSRPNEVARDIANRVALYRLAREELDDAVRASLEAVAQQGVLKNEKGHYANHTFPAVHRIGTGRDVFTGVDGQR